MLSMVSVSSTAGKLLSSRIPPPSAFFGDVSAESGNSPWSIIFLAFASITLSSSTTIKKTTQTQKPQFPQLQVSGFIDSEHSMPFSSSSKTP